MYNATMIYIDDSHKTKHEQIVITENVITEDVLYMYYPYDCSIFYIEHDIKQWNGDIKYNCCAIIDGIEHPVVFTLHGKEL